MSRGESRLRYLLPCCVDGEVLRDQESVECLKKRLARSVDVKWKKLAGRIK